MSNCESRDVLPRGVQFGVALYSDTEWRRGYEFERRLTGKSSPGGSRTLGYECRVGFESWSPKGSWNILLIVESGINASV